MDPLHADALSRAVSAVLATDVAELAFAQILDGLPIADEYADRYYAHLDIQHPLNEHTALCPGVVEKLRDIRSTFDPSMLEFEPRLVEVFQEADENSREFLMRLIEMTAVAIHQIAVSLFKLDTSLHKDDGILSWMPEEHSRSRFHRKPPPTFFSHTDYQCQDQYPNGLADMVGYWAENRILGGVVLFDRGESGFECRDIYFHSDHYEVTFRIYKLLDNQVEALGRLLRSNQQTRAESILPILGGKENRDRVDPDDAIDIHGIFRDRWEREIPIRDYNYYRTQRDVRSALDYPEIEDEMKARNEFWASRK